MKDQIPIPPLEFKSQKIQLQTMQDTVFKLISVARYRNGMAMNGFCEWPSG
jgi:hypothetical protein